MSAMVEAMIKKSIKDSGIKQTLGTRAAESLTVFLGAPLFDFEGNSNPDVFVTGEQFGFIDHTRNLKCFLTYCFENLDKYILSQKETHPTFGEIIQRLEQQQSVTPVKFVAELGDEWVILQGTDVKVVIYNAFIGQRILQQQLATPQ